MFEHNILRDCGHWEAFMVDSEFIAEDLKEKLGREPDQWEYSKKLDSLLDSLAEGLCLGCEELGDWEEEIVE